MPNVFDALPLEVTDLILFYAGVHHNSISANGAQYRFVCRSWAQRIPPMLRSFRYPIFVISYLPGVFKSLEIAERVFIAGSPLLALPLDVCVLVFTPLRAPSFASSSSPPDGTHGSLALPVRQRAPVTYADFFEQLGRLWRVLKRIREAPERAGRVRCARGTSDAGVFQIRLITPAFQTADEWDLGQELPLPSKAIETITGPIALSVSHEILGLRLFTPEMLQRVLVSLPDLREVELTYEISLYPQTQEPLWVFTDVVKSTATTTRPLQRPASSDITTFRQYYPRLLKSLTYIPLTITYLDLRFSYEYLPYVTLDSIFESSILQGGAGDRLSRIIRRLSYSLVSLRLHCPISVELFEDQRLGRRQVFYNDLLGVYTDTIPTSSDEEMPGASSSSSSSANSSSSSVPVADDERLYPNMTKFDVSFRLHSSLGYPFCDFRTVPLDDSNIGYYPPDIRARYYAGTLPVLDTYLPVPHALDALLLAATNAMLRMPKIERFLLNDHLGATRLDFHAKPSGNRLMNDPILTFTRGYAEDSRILDKWQHRWPELAITNNFYRLYEGGS
ncbi:uncharacterized protein V1518DRAFT_416161 [Limtongia smithiae]|uniref:uncharacterized protein n=1 Tax=Limtongia smithiae TaxID=1125753 RepID=UPI0034CE4BF9